MSQTNPTVNEIEVLAKSSVMGKSHVDGFKAAYPRSKAKSDSLKQAAYLAYQNTDVHLTIERIREEAKVLASADTIADLAECQAALTQVIRVGLEKREDGSLRDSSGVKGAASELMKQRGDYEHNEHEGTTVILNQDIPGCND